MDDDCRRHNEAAVRLLSEGSILGKPVLGVIIAERFPQGWSNLDRKVDLDLWAGTEAHREFTEGLREVLHRLEAAGIPEVALMLPVPELRNLPSRCLLREATAWCGMPRELYERITGDYAMTLKASAARVSGGNVIDPISYLCGQDRCSVLRGETVLYYDDDHISPEAAEAFAGFYQAERHTGVEESESASTEPGALP